jgi:hypothetical protein
MNEGFCSLACMDGVVHFHKQSLTKAGVIEDYLGGKPNR